MNNDNSQMNAAGRWVGGKLLFVSVIHTRHVHNEHFMVFRHHIRIKVIIPKLNKAQSEKRQDSCKIRLFDMNAFSC